MLEARLENLKQTIKIDISTNDVITPAAVIFSYKLMFEDRSIPLWTYNLETLLSEKLETVVARGTANTRMRDFYDIHIITNQEAKNLNYEILHKALYATSSKRNTLDLIEDSGRILDEVRTSIIMEMGWKNYKKENFFVVDLTWNQVVDSVCHLMEKAKET